MQSITRINREKCNQSGESKEGEVQSIKIITMQRSNPINQKNQKIRRSSINQNNQNAEKQPNY